MTGIITEKLHAWKVGYDGLPGGIGTLEEIIEIITLLQLGYHQKPFGILNIADSS